MQFQLEDEYITLQQLLKVCDIISSGGQIKAYLAENTVLVNGEPENRRGKKLRAGDVVEAENKRIEIV
ncbi:MAG: S4 domain-containing protein YaaA [Ileibacterium sp.]|nr:S4 domain-containing protein YaaA [Ileibacterium sp.]